MATVRKLDYREISRITPHSEVAATVSAIECDGEKFIQIDTYGSPDRMLEGKMSQTLRLTAEAFERLSQIAGKHF